MDVSWTGCRLRRRLLVEFTGERLVPGQVDQDLWNEHFARYAFAVRLARRKRVLDIACGMGYGSAELARVAQRVTSFDVSPEAVQAAAARYAASNLTYLCASAEEIPLPDASFDLIVAFEVIEHLSEWPRLLSEAKRLLAPGGQFIVSTPNKSYYGESRRLSGPNPYHVHEFEYDEFRTALAEVFPSVTIFVQNHVGGILFQPCGQAHSQSADVTVERGETRPESAHFYVAVCALSPQTGAPSYAYLPAAANVLRERELHIQKLEAELETKNAWLADAQSERDRMIEVSRVAEQAREEAQVWARQQDAELDRARKEIQRLEQDVVQELQKKIEELARCVELLDKAEATVVERTKWAQDLERELSAARAQIGAAQASRWMRLGRKFGLGPDLAS